MAALCLRQEADRQQVLLITSRDTGRWILPKGWPIEGKTSPEAAMQEAWEEAGVRRGRLCPEPVGTYHYDKTISTGWAMPVETLVFSVEVEELADDFPEVDERRRGWFSPQEASERVDEPELKAILREFGT
ncbi:NUDIX hydrolase [Sulfitobacter sp. D35]|uniref:NUDIX hydrolase n=1 Tax=Sulfitobacter sp. D35 TaxID=3083252 RepID=UPI0039905E5D